MAPPPLKRMKQTGDLRLTAEIDYAKLLHEAQVLEESSNFACCLSGDRGSVCAGSSAGVVTTWDLMAEGRPVAATWDAGVGAIYDMAVNGDVVVLGGDRGLGVAAAAAAVGRQRPEEEPLLVRRPAVVADALLAARGPAVHGQRAQRHGVARAAAAVEAAAAPAVVPPPREAELALAAEAVARRVVAHPELVARRLDARSIVVGRHLWKRMRAASSIIVSRAASSAVHLEARRDGARVFSTLNAFRTVFQSFIRLASSSVRSP